MPHKSVCPLCRRPVDRAFSPFCSRGCRDRDLLAWMGEDYRLPAHLAEDEEAESVSPSRERGDD